MARQVIFVKIIDRAAEGRHIEPFAGAYIFRRYAVDRVGVDDADGRYDTADFYLTVIVSVSGV